MAKESGLGFSVAVDDSGGTPRTISNDITSLDFATPRTVQEVTGVDKSAMERILTLADFSSTMNGVFNDATNMSFDVIKTVPSTSPVSRTITLGISGQTLATENVISDATWKRSDKGEFTWTIATALADGSVPTWA